MRLLSFHKIGSNRETPRIFLDSARLTNFGFGPGTRYSLEQGNRRITLRPAPTNGKYTVSSRRSAGGVSPVIDLASRITLASLAEFTEARITAVQDSITITPSVRAFHIRRALNAEPPFRVVEFFAGGGTLSKAFDQSPYFNVIAGMEIDTAYADCWQAAHPDATLIQGDIRLINPCEIHAHEILVAGIPCTDHSPMGRAKKGLAGRPELGGTGDLFIHVLAHIQHHTPLVCLFENVPSFGTSLAGETLKANLRQIGYDVSEMTTSPNEEWNEPSDRKRWVCVATLIPGFAIQSPMKPFAGKASDYLDAADPVQDKLDAERIATTITGLRAHNARHQAMGHGFGFTTLNGSETKIPTIVKSYHKINVGPFVETAFGPRMLRKHEIEKIQGCEVSTTHYATAVQILGQGVQTRVFSQIVDQLAAFLINPKGVVASAPIPVEFGQLSLFAA